MKNVIVTGGRSPVTLDLVRLFAKNKNNVYIVESFKDNISGASKYIKKNIILPSPALETEDFIQNLIDTIIEYKIDLVVPTCEEVFYLAKYKSRIEKHCKLFTPSWEVLEELHSKYKFIELLNKLDIPAPKSERLFTIESVKTAINSTEKFVLKPEYSRFASFVIINDRKPEKINNVNISENYPWVFQEYIKGQAYCSYSVAQDGKVLAHGVYPSVYCAGQGATIHFESHQSTEILKIVKKIVKKLNYTGQISFDFIKSDTDNIYYPIECNPRATSGIYLFSEKLIDSFFKVDEDFKLVTPNTDKPKMVALAMLIYGLPSLRTKNQLKDFIKDFYKSDDVIFKINDPKPFLSQFKGLAHYLRIAKKNNISLLEASTLDIEWNGK